MKNIVLTGGGTAGHVYPALAVRECLGDEYNVHFIGGKGMEKDIVEKEKDIKYYQIDAVKLQRKLTLSNLLIPFKLLKAINQAKKILKEIKPCAIFSKGGFVAVPVVIAGKSLKIPIVSHESDLSLGLANKIILKFCTYMATAFELTSKQNEKCVFTGQPIRQKVLNGNKKHLEFYCKLDKSKPNLLVIGGSTGAKFINDKIWANLDKLTKFYNIIHITGKQNKQEHVHKNYFEIKYADNIGDYLDLADIILSRAGSGAINEFLALKKPMLLIPLSKKCSRGDQIENAKLFAKLGYCDMLLEEDYDDNLFKIKLSNLYKDKEYYVKNMNNCKIENASKNIVELIKKVEIK